MLRDRRPRALICLGTASGSHMVELYHGTDLAHRFYFGDLWLLGWHCDLHPDSHGTCRAGLTFMERKAIQEAE